MAFDLRTAIGSIAPTLATMLGGPLVGGAVAALLPAFGITSTGDQSRDLGAITLSYINQSLQDNGQGTLAQFLSRDLSAVAADFASTTAPSLTKQLADVLNNTQTY